MKYLFLLSLISLTLLIKYFKPLLFSKKKKLDKVVLISWKKVLSGYRIFKRKASKFNLAIPQCKVCFLESVNRSDQGTDTNYNPIYADYNVLCIKVKNNIVFVCKKHKLQIEVSKI